MRTPGKTATPRRGQPEPTWDIAHLFPAQGSWSEEDYLALDTNRLVEYVEGRIEVLPVPTTTHQLILKALFRLLDAFVEQRRLGMALFAGTRVKVADLKIREPDIVFVSNEHAEKIGEEYWKGADLVVEIVSADVKDRERDLIDKRREYARAGISEYWIVDPEKETISVLALAGKRYVEHGVYALGARASSKLLSEFSVDVTEVLRPRLLGKTNGKRTRKSS